MARSERDIAMDLDGVLTALCAHGVVERDVELVVLNVQRFLTDKTFPNINSCDGNLMFDVTLTDGQTKVKCLLDEILNELVTNKRIISVGQRVVVSSMKLIYSSHCVPPAKIVLVRSIRALSNPKRRTVGLEQFSNLPWSTVECMPQESLERDTPLSVKRSYYLPLWDTRDLEGVLFNTDYDWEIDHNNIPEGICRINNITRKQGVDPPVIIGRVVVKSSLLHSENLSQPYPFQFSIEIQDQTGTVLVVFWEKQCAFYIGKITLGDVILLKHYRVRRRYSDRSNAYIPLGTRTIAVQQELSVGTPSPEATTVFKVTGFNENANALLLEIPFVACRIISQQMLNKGDFGEKVQPIFDLAGIVVFLGEHQIDKSPKGPNLYQYQWVYLSDGTAKGVIPIKLYPCSQPKALRDLVVGKLLVVLRVLFVQDMYAAGDVKSNHFTSCRETQLYPMDPSVPDEKFGSMDEIKKIKQWFEKNRKSFVSKVIKTLSCNASYPPLPVSLQTYRADTQLDETMVSVEGLMRELSEIPVMCPKIFTLQGTIACFEFHVERKDWEWPNDEGFIRGLQNTKIKALTEQHKQMIDSSRSEVASRSHGNTTIVDESDNSMHKSVILHLPTSSIRPACFMDSAFEDCSPQNTTEFMGMERLRYGEKCRPFRSTCFKVVIRPLNGNMLINSFFIPIPCCPGNLCRCSSNDVVMEDNLVLEMMRTGCFKSEPSITDVLDAVEALKGVPLMVSLNATNLSHERTRFILSRAFRSGAAWRS